MANITDKIETKYESLEAQIGTSNNNEKIISLRSIVEDLIALVKDLDERLKKLE